MRTPLVTIAIPFFNNETTLLDAVKSVFVQTFADWELILVNDGSTDRSLELVKELKDTRIRIIDDGYNRGLIYRLNQVSALAKGKFIARMDADDLMLPNRIAKQVDFLLKNPEIDLVDTGAYTINECGRPVGKRGIEVIDTHEKKVLKHALLLHASVLGKREWFVKNPYDPEYVRAEDYELWCRTYRHSNFGRVREHLYIVREGKINVTNYAASMKTLRKVFAVYGKGVLSNVSLYWQQNKTHLKTGVYYLMALIGRQDVLTAMRNIPLTAKEKNDLEKEIRKIQLFDIFSD
ncbi:hypothetical protein GCM10011386_20320 [Parapedobacter defluvii]|uniref:Glycosyltransferase 2-like domain-containing protein n=1 Tax=Parapedobacter defluvii TaxID=2045106 RepID=A0ABQ1LS46_9SPHI|nr:glycosyltransferase [Parapedobacter defluvii]GGC28221.1 hypothetical protein GCM10011386_20320 [Parapedobacter defluvii]